VLAMLSTERSDHSDQRDVTPARLAGAARRCRRLSPGAAASRGGGRGA
jgi:hypothetical protein